MALYAFDGTGNRDHSETNANRNSNVFRFKEAYQGERFYVPGVGTRFGLLGKIFGTILGAGGRTRIREGLAALEANVAKGDRDVDIVGFSRGAALALHFANEVAERGLTVRFLGLWDVVGSFGIPFNFGPFQFQRVNVGWKLTLPQGVKHCFHAIALDERRQAFRVTRVAGAYEVWFRGVHSDIGGGNENLELSNIALAWMLRKAARAGVPVDPAVADSLQVDPDAPVRPSELDLIENDFREVLPVWMHHTIKIREHQNYRPVPPGCPVETPELERERISLIS
ncbi:MAG TPA: DUF2235 domain-containing protein [Thermoanaerobaculia bacterium]|nr:DUF2235 domain-containing protein [Thermoanaerobaculia bacterium]